MVWVAGGLLFRAVEQQWHHVSTGQTVKASPQGVIRLSEHGKGAYCKTGKFSLPFSFSRFLRIWSNSETYPSRNCLNWYSSIDRFNDS